MRERERVCVCVCACVCVCVCVFVFVLGSEQILTFTFIYFPVQILFLPLDDIAKIEISGGASRTFDIMVHLHDFGVYEFTMISRDFEQSELGRKN